MYYSAFERQWPWLSPPDWWSWPNSRSATVLTSGQWRYGYWANSTNQEKTATAIAVRKRWRRCSTYARPVDGAVLTESALAKTELKHFKLSKMRHG